MTRANEHYAIYHQNFKDKRGKQPGRLLAQGLTPAEIPVTFITGKSYEITFEYLCNVPGCRILYNFYNGPDMDLQHHSKMLEYSEDFKPERLVIVCSDAYDVQQMDIRLWVMDHKKRIFLRNIKATVLGGAEAEKYEAQVQKSQKKVERPIQPFIGNLKDIKLETQNAIKLKECDVAFLAYVKDEGKYYLERLIRSVIDYVPKLVIVDTGSTDNTKEIVTKYQDRDNFTFIEHPCTEKEIFEGINAGVAECKTEWIFITAGDEAFLKEDLFKVPGAIEEAKKNKARVVRISYLDFIGDDKHYHNKYACTAYRIWRNFKGFHFGGDFQGDIYMAYNDGIQTGGVETKKHMPPEVYHERLDIFFHHYARCKPKDILLQKRIKYYARRIENPTEERVLESAKNCPFYTLDPVRLKIKEYNGPQAGLEIPKQKMKIGYYTANATLDHFAQPILKRLRRDGHKVKITHSLGELKKMYDRMGWIWFEWGEKWLVDILKTKKKCKIAVRIHRYEVERSFAEHINWNNVDLLWFVNEDVKLAFEKRFPKVTTRKIVIPNAVDVRQITFQNRKKYSKNIILYSIRFSPIKDFPTAVNVFNKVSEVDKKFSMTLRAMTPPDGILKQLKESTKGKNVKFITTPIDLSTIEDKDDVNTLLEGKDVFLSTSKYEGFGYTIAESLASGLQVFVRNWGRGGRPGDFWDPYLCNSENDMAQKIIDWSKKSNAEKKEISLANRKYVVDNFSPEIITAKLLDALKPKGPPHVCFISAVYNNEKFLEQTLKSMLNQTYPFVSVIMVNDESTDGTRDILERYKDRIYILDVPHGGAHYAMSKGHEYAQKIGADYTVISGSDDLHEPHYIEEMVKIAEAEDAYLVYPNFIYIDENNQKTGEFISQKPDVDVLRKDTYICDHSLVSAKFWNEYGWNLQHEKFKAYSILHFIISNFQMFPGKQRWANKLLWKYRQHDNNLHTRGGIKKERQGQRQKVVKTLFGDE